MNLKAIPNIVYIIAAGGLAFWYLKNQAGEVIEAVGTAVNPASQDNLVNQGVSAIGEVITGEEGFSLGSALYDLFNDDPDVTAPTAIPMAG